MSTYSSRLKIELIGDGEQANSWGNTTNNTFSNTIEESIANVYPKNLTGVSSPYVLTSADGPVVAASNEFRQAAIRFFNHTSDFIIQVPSSLSKLFFIINSSNTGAIILRSGSAGLTFRVPPAKKAFVATDGTNWYDLETTSTTWRDVSGNFTAYAGDKIMVDTSGGVANATLPTAPSLGDEIHFLDKTGSFDNNALTLIAGGTINIFGATANATVSTEDAAFSIVYTGASATGWKLTEK
tara:strand:+ start:1516 stop:2235 length:720 start_codon:yes stop_codon:yes gene_type:complete